MTRPTIYRAWINQPSTQQQLHNLHGRRCIAVDDGSKSIRIYFTKGPVHSMEALRESISRTPLSRIG